MSKRAIDTLDFLAMCGRIVRSAGRRVGEADGIELAALVAIGDDVDQAIVAAVRGLRAAGHTWESIGQATGTSRQAAIMKWARRI